MPGSPFFYEWVPCHCGVVVLQPQVVSLELLDRAHIRWCRGLDHICVHATITDTTQTPTATITYTTKRRRTDLPKHPIIYKPILTLLATRGTITVRDWHEKFAINPVAWKTNVRCVMVPRSGPFNMVIFHIRRFIRQAELNWALNHKLISKYWVRPFGHKNTRSYSRNTSYNLNPNKLLPHENDFSNIIYWLSLNILIDYADTNYIPKYEIIKVKSSENNLFLKIFITVKCCLEPVIEFNNRLLHIYNKTCIKFQ